MPPMNTVLLPAKVFVEPPPPAAGADEPVLPLGTLPGEVLPPLAVVVPPGAWLVGPGVLLPGAAGVVGVVAEPLDAPGRGAPPSLVTAVPAVVLDDVATACW
jgi:hypothetical protein